VDTARKVDPEDEKKLIEFIQSELLRNVDPKSIRAKLVQAGWLEADVLRLIGVATAKPDLKAGAVKAVDLEKVAHGALILLLVWHAYLLQRKFLG
jgi:hypothetical protein